MTNPCVLPLRLDTLGKHMPRQRRQNGFVKPTGKSPRTWTGYWYEYVVVDGRERRRERSKVLGFRSEMTKSDAQKKLRDLLLHGPPKTDEAPPKPLVQVTFEAAALRYLELKNGDWGRKMRSCITSIFQNHLIPALGDKMPGDVKATDVKIFFNAIAERGSQSLVRKAITHTRGVFDALVDDGVIPANPARAKSVTQPKTRKPSERFLSIPECRSLLSAATGRDYVILRILLSCALRPSEVFALRVEDVLPGKLRIDEAAVPGGDDSGETKTEESNGVVPIAPALEAELRAYMRAENLTHPRELLFPTEIGTLVSHDNYLDRVLKPIAAAAKIPGVNFQVLRRTMATHLQNHGTVKSAQALLRHTDPSTTLKHYQKTLDDGVIRAAESWDGELTRTETVQ